MSTDNFDLRAFNNLKKGNRISFCFDGNFTVTHVYKVNDEVQKITVKSVSDPDETLTLDADDIPLISLLS